MSNKVVYVSYGSNMFTERFMAYIAGGTPTGASRTYEGCEDKTPPSHKFVLTSNAHIGYFARNSTVWGEAPYADSGSGNFGGLGVIGVQPDVEFEGLKIVDPAETSLRDIRESGDLLMAGYLITDEQFRDVVIQENRKALGDIEFPQSIVELLDEENPVIDLRNRTGENAIVLEDGSTAEFSISGAYSALLYLGEIEVDGELVKAVTFTTPLDYKRAAAQTYLNMVVGTISDLDTQQKAMEGGLALIERIMPNVPADKLHRLNPGSQAYVEMVVNGILEMGEGQSDWTRDNAIEYVLTQPPFNEHQMPEFSQMIRESLGIKPQTSDLSLV
jgi:hypothetical protein